jgi:acetyl esterase/lipase
MAVDGVLEIDRSADRTRYRDVVYAEVPGFRPLLLDLVVPAEREPTPLVLYLHGGGFAGGTHQVARYPPAHRASEALLARGVAVASVGYRLSGEARFPAQVQDVWAAVRWLGRHGTDVGVDADRMAAWGDSAGGYLTAMLAVTAHRPELTGSAGPGRRIRAGVSWYGPSNLATQPPLGPPAWRNTDPARSPEAKLLGAPVADVPGLAAAASPVSHVTENAAPLLLVHGTADDGVPFAQSEELVAAYDRAGAPIELVAVPGAGHGLRGTELGPLLDRSAGFLVRHLRGPLTGRVG